MALRNLTAISTLDGALAALSSRGPVLSNGLTNHSPMVAEVLTTLGRGRDIGPWLEEYAPLLRPWPAARSPLGSADWQSALGAEGRMGDWRNCLTTELVRGGAPELLRQWLPRLLPGCITAAMHGLIRCAHAVRGWSTEPTPEGECELADALAYWAATHQALPRRPSSETALGLGAALEQLPSLPLEQRRSGGNITASLAPLFQFEPFLVHAERVHVEDPARFLCELTLAFAHVFLANARDGLSTIVFVHALTGPAALRLLLPYLGTEDARAGAWHAWQASAALYATFGVAPPLATLDAQQQRRELPAARPWPELVDQAILSGDEHAIKFVEACQREAGHALDLGLPSEAYGAAATQAVNTLGRRERTPARR
jgi:hypothetical protein